MPIKRPHLNLDLSSLQSLSSSVPIQKLSTLEHLRSNFDNLKSQLTGGACPLFREAPEGYDYPAACRIGSDTLHNGFMVYNAGVDAFVHVCRDEGQCKGAYDGDKLHISVKRDEMPQAFGVLSKFLFSEDCPIDKWKFVHVSELGSGNRVCEGAQFTLYVKPDAADSQFTTQALSRLRHFVERLESEMASQNIHPGKYPDSDVRPSHWQFISYRNEMRSQREGSEEQSVSLSNEPLYRLLTELS